MSLPLRSRLLALSLRPSPSTTRLAAPIQPFLPHTHTYTTTQTRWASGDFMSKVRAKERAKAKATAPKKRKTFRAYDMKDMQYWTLCDAMRYIRAFEVGYAPDSPKYELHIRLKTKRNGAVIKNSINLPHPFQPSARICVICPPGSKAAKQAAEAGAEIIGQEDVFEQIKAGKIEFEKCICHPASLQALNKAQLGRILGPKGLMPSAKLGTVTDNIAAAVSSSRVGLSYRERDGVVRLGIGRLGFSPEMLRDNISMFVAQLKKDMAAVQEDNPKEIMEVVLSSTHAPGFTLNGEFKSDDSPSSQELTGN
ncbi:50S ribosomal protein L1 [Ascosphaera apis ARSEF 7405]|uniref:50S ribosomal protein L1 n=1 Tax=Ascosphaera apis ARSEF 7405 TaxID=392613 RepID=A0A167XS94_9EURO|nr:50S ribosomal protein L1 [Ascosphaera apis ARSEF 7405]